MVLLCRLMGHHWHNGHVSHAPLHSIRVALAAEEVGYAGSEYFASFVVALSRYRPLNLQLAAVAKIRAVDLSDFAEQVVMSRHLQISYDVVEAEESDILGVVVLFREGDSTVIAR